MFGFLNINKPKGVTSHKVISILRKITSIKQIGHAGTLDPLAQGVLPVAIGKAVKLIDFLQERKCYQVSLNFGFISDTYDIEGNVENTNSRKVKLNEVKEALSKFKGEIKQTPPVYSAVHYKGKRLYELARKGQIPVDIKQRIITVYKNEILNFDYENQILNLNIECSKGTYIRSIVHDLGLVLGTGAIMKELVRTKSAGMSIENSLKLTENITKKEIENNLINPLNIIDMDSIEIKEEEFKKIVNGNKYKNVTQKEGQLLLTKEGNVIAIAIADSDYIQPRKILI